MASRRRTLLWLILALLAAGGGWAAWWQLIGRFYETTDNAYVAGNLIEVTPQVAGTVVAIGADDTDRVQAGQMLVRLDAADAQVALDQAEAELARAVREARTLYANNLTLEANVRVREAELQRAEVISLCWSESSAIQRAVLSDPYGSSPRRRGRSWG